MGHRDKAGACEGYTDVVVPYQPDVEVPEMPMISLAVHYDLKRGKKYNFSPKILSFF